jgi:DNA invertase Pin-like site-specific DNA recombinase
MKAIAYYRVSTKQQGVSGLGLEAQQSSVLNYIAGKYELINSYIEIESGKRNDRPQLIKAIEECKKQKAILIIAKLDRLARNVYFISSLMESKVEFIAVDNPTANKLMIHILAAFAEHERDMISQRTKEALNQAKLRGVKLGNPKIAAQNSEKAKLIAAEYQPLINELKLKGLSIKNIAKELNLHPTQVQRFIKYCK